MISNWYRMFESKTCIYNIYMHLLFPALTGRVFFETVCSVICIPPVSVICSWRTLFLEWTWFILSLQGRQWATATVYVPGLFPRPWIEPLLNTDQHSEIALGCRLWPSTTFYIVHTSSHYLIICTSIMCALSIFKFDDMKWLIVS
jgi:hypothetical protein